MQPLLLLKQTLEAPYDPGAMLLDGPHVSFDNAAEMFSSGGRGYDISESFSVGIQTSAHGSSELTFGRSEGGIEVLQKSFKRAKSSGEPKPRTVNLTKSASRSTLARAVAPIFRIMTKIPGRTASPVRIGRDRSFLTIEMKLDEDVPGFDLPTMLDDPLRTISTEMIHLPGLRDNPSRQYPVTHHGSIFPGPFPVYTASLLAHWAEVGDERLAALGLQLKELGLTWKVEAKRMNDTRVIVRVGRLPKAKVGGARDLVNLADVGLGVSQTLPVLVALQTATKNQTVYVEQPELHLHPRAQLAMGRQLASAARRGVQVVCETHSHLILQSIQTEVAEGNALPELVSLNWFSRDSEGFTRIDSGRLASDGSFGDWPVDFADVELESERAFVSSLFQ